RAAMTGHQVFSTLHTNSALGAIPRLLDIGVKPDILAGNIIGIVAQRLVRKLCDKCKEAYEIEDLERNLLNLKSTDRQQVIYRSKGCPACEGQGYKGRMSLIEVLKFDSDMDELVARNATSKELLRMALSKGFKPLADVGSARVIDGSTSIEEVARVVDLTSRLKQK
ncbi:MAG: Flp pilus assembly complex ATPase component TadA, partial [Gammaproteobacteria bacterium]|nr:Flp pilus assembly complex ATPase component TadA [Gammaproteobacteria bacterium]